MNLTDVRPAQAANDLSHVDASELLDIDFLDGLRKRLTVALIGVQTLDGS